MLLNEICFSQETKNLRFQHLNLSLKSGNAAAEDNMIFLISITPKKKKKKNYRSFAHHSATLNVYNFRMQNLIKHDEVHRGVQPMCLGVKTLTFPTALWSNTLNQAVTCHEVNALECISRDICDVLLLMSVSILLRSASKSP